MYTIMLLATVFSCSSKSADSTDSADTTDTQDEGNADTSDSDTQDTGPTQVPDGTHGSVPSEFLDAPEFVATNRDGTSRGRDDLVGDPTVMWFYPAAGTSG